MKVFSAGDIEPLFALLELIMFSIFDKYSDYSIVS